MNGCSFAPSEIGSYLLHIPEYIQNGLSDGCQAIGDAMMRPIYFCRDRIQIAAEKIQNCVKENLDALKDVCQRGLDAIMEHQFAILYFSTLAISAMQNITLFSTAATVGVIFSLVFSSITHIQGLDINFVDPEVQKNMTIAQSTLSLISFASHVMTSSRWLHSSTEGAIATSISGALLGHLGISFLKKGMSSLSLNMDVKPS